MVSGSGWENGCRILNVNEICHREGQSMLPDQKVNACFTCNFSKPRPAFKESIISSASALPSSTQTLAHLLVALAGAGLLSRIGDRLRLLLLGVSDLDIDLTLSDRAGLRVRDLPRVSSSAMAT